MTQLAIIEFSRITVPSNTKLMPAGLLTRVQLEMVTTAPPYAIPMVALGPESER
jgi:hypothetical protein